MIPRSVKWALLGLAALFGVALFQATYFTVNQNERTVVSTWGKFSYVADPGLHFKLPVIQTATEYRTDILSLGPREHVNTFTFDNQEIDVIFKVFYRLPPQNIAYIYENARDYDKRLYDLALDRLKVEVGQVNTSHVAERRGELRDKVKSKVVEAANTLGVAVVDFQLLDLKYQESFRNAVNNAAVQKANVEAQEYLRQQALKNAERAQVDALGKANAQREQAKGNADAILVEAEATAKGIKLKGEAEAEAIKAQASALKDNATLVTLRQAERWDGKLPTQIFGSAPLPIMNLGSK